MSSFGYSFFLDFYWIKFSTTNEKYLFTPQIGKTFGTTDSASIAKEIEKEQHEMTFNEALDEYSNRSFEEYYNETFKNEIK